MHSTASRLAAAALAAAALAATAGTAHAGGLPPIGPAPALHVKYILPPRSSAFYDDVRNAALAAGYDVVENDDLSYPGPRR